MDLQARLAVASGICLLPLAPLAARLAHLQVLEHRQLQSRVEGEVLHAAHEALGRGEILDRRGRLLAQSVPAWSCFLDKTPIKDARAAAERLSPLLAMPASEIRRRMDTAARVVRIKDGLDGAQFSAVTESKLPGVNLILTQKRLYPNQELARNVLGIVGAQEHGLSGLELVFDERLRGKPRLLAYLRDGSGRVIQNASGPAAQRPEPLRLSINRDIQFHAEEVLREATAQFKAKGGMIIVEEPATGALLAMAATPPTHLKNPMVQDTYEPGSTFKLVTAAAALEESVVSLEDPFFCENGTYEVSPGVFIHDHEPSANLNLQGILEHSSNIGIAKVAEKVGTKRFYRYTRAFGFGLKTGVTLPGETAGQMKSLPELTKVVLAASSYGYGLGVSALQVADAYSALANGGTLYEPTILDGKRPVRVRRVISEKTAQTLTRMLEGVVEHGTGASARIPGWRVAGKTGTARKVDPRTGEYSNSAYMASFVGFLPASRPRWTILVVMDEPKGQYYGAQVSAPVFAKLARRLLAMEAVPPDADTNLAAVP